jgi:hypothetical protein
MLRWLKKSLFFSALTAMVAASSDAFAAVVDAPTTVGGIMITIVNHSNALTQLINMTGWIAGAYCAITGIYKFKEHVDNPAQTPLHVPMRRVIGGGLFLSLPFVAEVLRGSLFGGLGYGDNNAYADALATGDGTAGGLDTMVLNVMNDIAGPIEFLLTFFTYLSACILLVVGINRLTRKMEEGPRGPAGFGTIMTFITAGALFSMGDMIGTFANSVFGTMDGAHSLTRASLVGIDLDDDAAERVQNVIQAVMYFVLIVGMIAFIRGWFVLRAFADGQQGATLAQGLTFLIGGTLAINLGDLVNLVQATIGVGGIAFY